MKIFWFVITLAIIQPHLLLAQETADSNKTNNADSTQPTTPADTSFETRGSEAERRIDDMQERLDEFKESEKAKPSLSFYDSVMTYLVGERFNRRDEIDQSFFHDAGDYFKFDPEYFVLDFQSTPMRKTVRPFGLTGKRLNVFSAGHLYAPLEHVVEPDGLIDLNDIPTALDGSIYVVPGPTGMFLGGESNVASLITSKSIADSNKPYSSFMADRGYFGYAFVRGCYDREFTNGRKISLSASSRKSDGVVFGRDDDQGHYTMDVELPMNKNLSISAAGSLYDREGRFTVRPDIGGLLISRERFERSLLVSVSANNDSLTQRTSLGYKHDRQGSYLGLAYNGHFDNTTNGAVISHERMIGERIFQAVVKVDFTDYDNGSNELHRFNSSTAFSVMPLRRTNQLSFTTKVDYSNKFDILPSAGIVYQSEHAKLYYQLSFGVAVREPTLHQLYLPFQQRALYGVTTEEYSDSGNPNLKKETELIGNFTFQPGTVDNNISINVTGGRIKDAIEWSAKHTTGAINVTHFMPVNDDITFVNASVKPSFRIADNLRFTGGGAYYHYKYDSLGDRPYQPEYNLFSGLELHYYWAQRLVDLYAYGEIMYTGAYKGYDKQDLGEQFIANAKLSLGLKNFRFHFVFENVFDRPYEAREHMLKAGRFFYYGLVWKFFD